MRRRIYGFLAAGVMSCLLFAGCAPKMAYTPFDLNPQIKSGQFVQKTDNFIVLYDTSASMADKFGAGSRMAFAEDVTKRMVATIPDIKLTSGLRTFGGMKGSEHTELVYGVTSFNKSDFIKAVETIGSPVGRTPLGRTIEAAGGDLKGLPGNSAIIIVSDFEEIKDVDDIRPKTAIENAAKVKAQYGDRVCIYTVQIGNTPAPGGQVLAQEIVKKGNCGIAVNASDLGTPAAMSAFVEKVFLGPPPALKAEKAKVEPAQAPTQVLAPASTAIAEVERAAVAPAAESAAIAFEDIRFDYDKYNLKPEARKVLNKIGEFMKANKKAAVLIEGHCDERGTTEYNLALGERRASSAAKYLIDLGVDRARISTISYGKELPLDPAHNEEAWAKNRRDHVVITLKKK